MALGPYYIDGSIGGTGGAGTSGDPFRSWSDFLTAGQSLSGHGEVIVYMKNKCTVGNTGVNSFDCTGWSGNNATNYLHFKPWVGFEGDGTISGTPGWTEEADAYQAALILLQHCRITRLAVQNTATGTLGATGVRPNGGNITLDGVIAKAEDAGFEYGVGSVLINCIGIVGAGGAVFGSNESYGSYTLTNCTAITTGGGGTAFSSTGLGNTTTCVNCCAYGSFTTEWDGDFGAGSTNNAGQIASGSQPANIQTNYVQITAMPFDALAEPYQPSAAGQLADAGTASGAPTEDGLGTSRGSPPEIGWLEATAGGGASAAVILNHLRMMRER